MDDTSRSSPSNRIDRMSNKQVIVVLESGRGRMDVEHFRDLQILHYLQ